MSDHTGPEQTTDIIARQSVRFVPPGEWVTMPAAQYDALEADLAATRPLVEAALAYGAAEAIEAGAPTDTDADWDAYHRARAAANACHDALLAAYRAYVERQGGEVGA